MNEPQPLDNRTATLTSAVPVNRLPNDREVATLLAVDDSATNLKILATLLKKDYTVEVAANGEEAIESARQILPDLILLDIDMPGLNGFEVCTRLKQDPMTANIPIVFLSALGSAEHKVKGLELGACDYMTKPFQRDEILARVRTHLETAKVHGSLNSNVKILQKQNRNLDRFARNLAHDLRSPLTAVLGHASLLSLSQGLSDEAIESIRCIQEAGQNLNETVESLLLLAVSKSEEVEIAPIDTVDVAATCRSDLSNMINQYSGKVTIDSKLPRCLGYAPWMRRVFTNLISNGLKYSGTPPHIHISGSTGEGSVRYEVRDNGEAISQEDLGKLFKEFSRLAPQRAPGVGLGLVLVRTLIHRMGGSISVESSAQGGTVFTIEMRAPDLIDANRPCENHEFRSPQFGHRGVIKTSVSA